MSLERLPVMNLADQVADQLRSAIQEGRYPPGARLVERALAEELGVSHIPVREALSRLADEGLVERRPRKGSRVATLSPRELEEISTLRVVLEAFVATRVQQRMTPMAERELRELIAEMGRAATRRDYHEVFELDRRFHDTLCHLAEHRLLTETVNQLRGRIGAFLRAATSALKPDELVRHAISHETLLEAILSGSQKIAREEAERHIETAVARLWESGAVEESSDG